MRKSREKGVTLLIGTLSMLFIIPMMGLTIDVGFIYVVKAKLQAAVDGAALAAARALSIGQDLSSQTVSAQNNAVNWFNANFPSTYFGTTNTVMGTGNVNVFNDPNNPQLRNVTVTATTQVNTFFMRWLGFQQTTVTASGNASRRAVVAMLVLDRSGSMCSTSVSSCAGTGNSYPCSLMVKAAKNFVGLFAQGSDYVGLVSFSDNTYIHSAPVQNFQTTLGYTNAQGSGTGQLDTVWCQGGTGTAQAMSMAYQLLEQTNLPGALNVIVLETDGMPNSLTMDFWDSTNKVAGLQNGSSCLDNSTPTKKTIAQGGFASSAVIPNWTGGLNLQMSPFLTTSGVYSVIHAGMVGEVYSADPDQGTYFYAMMNYWTTWGQSQSTGSSGNFNSTTFTNNPGNPNKSASSACNFNSTNYYPGGPPSDLNWYPSTDVFGNQLKPTAYAPYQNVNTADSNGHIATNWTNYHAAVLNATENSAYQARSNANIPITVYTIGLGGNGAIDPVLLQRMANDPNGDLFNSPTNYSPCAQESGCATFSSQPQGEFAFSKDASNLGTAFLKIGSQMLRISK